MRFEVLIGVLLKSQVFLGCDIVTVRDYFAMFWRTAVPLSSASSNAWRMAVLLGLLDPEDEKIQSFDLTSTTSYPWSPGSSKSGFVVSAYMFSSSTETNTSELMPAQNIDGSTERDFQKLCHIVTAHKSKRSCVCTEYQTLKCDFWTCLWKPWCQQKH